jgi:hypothetical protein
MNLPAMLIGAGIGAIFFAAELTYYYTPSWINTDRLWDSLSSDHSRARAAVSRLLINPASAQFGLLRSVEAGAARYVCGDVKAKDKTGQYSEYRAFVYTTAADFARIDDDGRIAQRHASFHPCPIADGTKVAQQNALTSPGALAMVQKITPKPEPGAMEQQLGQLGGQASAGASRVTGQQSATLGTALGNELEWRSDRPPAAWPTFPPITPWRGRRTNVVRRKPSPWRKMSRTAGSNRDHPEMPKRVLRPKKSRKLAARCLQLIRATRNIQERGPPLSD